MSTRGDHGHASVLHNMSAPPRSRIELRPLGVARVDAVSVLEDDSLGRRRTRRVSRVLARPSACLFARVCLSGLLCDGRSDRAQARDIAQGLMRSAPIDLHATVAALRCGRIRTGYRKTTRYATALREVEAMPIGAVHDELLERLAAIDGSELPPLLLARPIDVAMAVPPCIHPMLALRLLAGTAGNLFIRDRSPGTGPFLSLAAGGPAVPYQFDYWLPVAPTAASAAAATSGDSHEGDGGDDDL
jgi:hypothetical protein